MSGPDIPEVTESEKKPPTAAELLPKIKSCLFLRRQWEKAAEVQEKAKAETEAAYKKYTDAVQKLTAEAIPGDYGERRIWVSDTAFVTIVVQSQRWPTLLVTDVEKP